MELALLHDINKKTELSYATEHEEGLANLCSSCPCWWAVFRQWTFPRESGCCWIRELWGTFSAHTTNICTWTRRKDFAVPLSITWVWSLGVLDMLIPLSLAHIYLELSSLKNFFSPPSSTLAWLFLFSPVELCLLWRIRVLSRVYDC